MKGSRVRFTWAAPFFPLGVLAQGLHFFHSAFWPRGCDYSTRRSGPGAPPLSPLNVASPSYPQISLDYHAPFSRGDGVPSRTRRSGPGAPPLSPLNVASSRYFLISLDYHAPFSRGDGVPSRTRRSCPGAPPLSPLNVASPRYPQNSLDYHVPFSCEVITASLPRHTRPRPAEARRFPYLGCNEYRGSCTVAWRSRYQRRNEGLH
jgi:hypothetical protein